MSKNGLVSTLVLSLVFSCACAPTSSISDSSSESSSKEPSSISETSSSENSQTESSTLSDSSSESSSSSSKVVACSYCNSKAKEVTQAKLGTYVPKTFQADTYKKTSKSLGDGVDLVQATFNLNNSDVDINVYMVEVDLNIATIAAGSYNNTTDPASYAVKSQIQAQANAYEKDTGKKVIAATNADFFGTDVVNAFAKDGYIIKASHNHDSNSIATDLPVSSPMLFGISNNQAQIGAMTDTKDKLTDVKSELVYGVEVYGDDCSSTRYVGAKSLPTYNQDETVSIITTKKINIPKGRVIVKVKNEEVVGTIMHGRIKSLTDLTAMKGFIGDDDYSYLAISTTQKDKFIIGNEVSFGYISSVDHKWDYYTQIIGARHAMIANGKLVDTLSSETSNGTSSRVPRTCVAIKEDGKVIIASVEDLHYGRKATICTGLTLTQMADFLRYYGATDAANFDGGGSSRLIAKNGLNGNGTFEDITQSSDATPRAVVNTIMVVTK